MTRELFTIAAGGDDFVHLGGVHSLGAAGDPLAIGDVGGLPQGVGLRYQLPIPQGVEVKSAKMTLQPSETIDLTTCIVEISGADEDDAVAPTTDGEWHTSFNGRTKTVVDWNPIPTFTNDVPIDTPDFTAIVHHIVNRPGWASGNHIIIFIDDSEQGRSTVNAQRKFDSFETSGGTPPILDITWLETDLVEVVHHFTSVPGRARMI